MTFRVRTRFWVGAGFIVAGLLIGTAQKLTRGEPPPADKPQESAKPPAAAKDSDTGNAKTNPAAPGAPVRLNPNGSVLLDKPGKRVLLKGQVVLQQGALELFCCLKQTKEHEAIVSVETKAYIVHTALLALGAKPGTPVRFDPKYQAPTGQRIDIFVNWKDESGKARREPAQSWIRHATRRFFGEPLAQLPAGLKLPKDLELRYDKRNKELSWYGQMTTRQKTDLLALSEDKPYRQAIESFFKRTQSRQMDAHWVFAGSGFYTDPDTGKKTYLAEDGDLICVANFSGATLDLALESSAGNEGLLFEAYTERIPPKETPVTIELIPVFAPEPPAPPK